MEVKRKSLLGSFLDRTPTKQTENKVEQENKQVEQVKEVKKEKESASASARQKNPKAYERNRGKGGSKPMSYYLNDEVIKAVALKALKEGKTKSEVVEEAVVRFLKKEIEEVKGLG